MMIKLFKINSDKDLWVNLHISKTSLSISPPYFTEYCIVHRLSRRELLFINTLSGAVDYVTGATPLEISRILSGRANHPMTEVVRKYFYERGYLFADVKCESKMRKKVIKKYPPDQLPYIYVVVLTTLCNFSCYYCSQRNITKTKRSMDDNELDQSLRFIKEHSKKYNNKFPTQIVNLYGGEPLLDGFRDKINKILGEAKTNQWKVNITTNGYTLLNYAALFKRFKNQMGGVLVTLDGPEQIHNLRRRLMRPRKQNTFRRISRGIEELLRIGVPCSVNVNIDKQNIKHLGKLMRYLHKKKWNQNPLFTFDISHVTDFYERQRYILGDRELRLLSGKSSLFDRLKVSNFTSKYQEYIEQFLDLKNPGKKISFTPPMIKGCFQRQFMVFHVDGKIYPCPTLACPERFPIGQFVPKAKIYMKKNKEYERISVSYLKKCRDCVMAFLCGGPCPARYCMRDRSINKILCMGQYEAEREVLRYLKRNVQALKKKISNFGAPFSAPDLILQKATSER